MRPILVDEQVGKEISRRENDEKYEKDLVEMDEQLELAKKNANEQKKALEEKMASQLEESKIIVSSKEKDLELEKQKMRVQLNEAKEKCGRVASELGKTAEKMMRQCSVLIDSVANMAKGKSLDIADTLKEIRQLAEDVTKSGNIDEEFKERLVAPAESIIGACNAVGDPQIKEINRRLKDGAEVPAIVKPYPAPVKRPSQPDDEDLRKNPNLVECCQCDKRCELGDCVQLKNTCGHYIMISCLKK